MEARVLLALPRNSAASTAARTRRTSPKNSTNWQVRNTRALSETSRTIRSQVGKLSVQMRNRKKTAKKPTEPLDRVLEKQPRGPHARENPSWTRGRADNFRWIFDQVWDRLWPLLSNAEDEEGVIRAFQEGARPYDREFMPALAGLVLKIVHESKFPKRRAPRINFLADSLAGRGLVAPRRARDICEKERARQKRAHHIIRYEVYVECSCGYKGLSRSHSCPKCKARIDFGFAPIFAALT